MHGAMIRRRLDEGQCSQSGLYGMWLRDFQKRKERLEDFSPPLPLHQTDPSLGISG
jgi:hypothetical protein